MYMNYNQERRETLADLESQTQLQAVKSSVLDSETLFSSSISVTLRVLSLSFPICPNPTLSFPSGSRIVVCAVSCSVVSNSATPRTVALQAPLSVGFSRQE